MRTSYRTYYNFVQINTGNSFWFLHVSHFMASLISLGFGYLRGTDCASFYEKEKNLKVTIVVDKCDASGNKVAGSQSQKRVFTVTNDDDKESNVIFKNIPFPSSSYVVYSVEIQGSSPGCYTCCRFQATQPACQPYWEGRSSVFASGSVPGTVAVPPDYKKCL